MQVNYIEWIANFFYIASTISASKNSVHTWWTGIVSCTLFLITFFQVKLYADVSLQLFFISTCIYGWVQWNGGSKNKNPLPISRVKQKYLILCVFISVVFTFLYGYFLFKLTNANNPFWDSTILAFSIFGQLLIMKRKIENWLVWILVDSISIPLYYSKGLYLTAMLYLGLLIIGFYGLFQWKKILSLQTKSTFKNIENL